MTQACPGARYGGTETYRDESSLDLEYGGPAGKIHETTRVGPKEGLKNSLACSTYSTLTVFNDM